MNLPIFVHIPKTAGSSIRTLISSNYSETEVLSLYGSHLEILQQSRDHIGKLSQFGLIQGHTPYGTHHFIGCQNPRYFSFLREPISRTLSDIAHSTRHPSHGFHHIFGAPKSGIKEKIEAAGKICYYRNNMTHFLSGNFYTQEISLKDFSNAVDNLWRSEFVGISEYFEKSVLIMGRMLGWSRFIPQKCNVRPDAGFPVTKEIIDLCSEFLDYDLQLYSIGLEEFEKKSKKYGSHLDEAADQLHEIIRQQTQDHPEAQFFVDYFVGDPTIVSLKEYEQKIPASSPLANWIKLSSPA